jgi:hypothetical protein
MPLISELRVVRHELPFLHRVEFGKLDVRAGPKGLEGLEFSQRLDAERGHMALAAELGEDDLRNEEPDAAVRTGEAPEPALRAVPVT